MKISEIYTGLKTKFKSVFSNTNNFEDKPPKEGDEQVGRYVGSLWDDANKSFENSFASTKETTRFGFNSPEDFYRACQKLEAGQHYEVYPSRTASGIDGIDNTWKQELIDNEIQKQIRAKKNHITASWHDIIISPNISGINEIFDQERKATGWSQRVREWVAYAQTFGECTVRSILDKTKNPDGVSTEITCKVGSVMRTPESDSLAKIDGCWYVIHGQRVNDSWVRKNYPKFDLTTTQTGKIPKFLQIDKDFKNTDYEHTKMYNKLEAFLDDESLEEVPFDPSEFDQRVGQMMSDIQSAQPVQVNPTPNDNHKKYIRAWLDWLEEKVKFYEKIAQDEFDKGGNLLPEDSLLMDNVVHAVNEQVNMHEALQSKDMSLPAGKRKKYRFGRYILTINGVVADDIPNPYNFEWRRLFNILKNESVPERKDGRGDVEILWQDNKNLDTFLSRYADDSLLATFKKPWFLPDDRVNIEKDGYSTNPLKPGYANRLPQFASGSANNQYLESYKIVKDGIKESLSVNQVTRGESSFSGESGAHAEALLNQNVVQVAGELNQNLNDFLEDIVETRIMMWKEFYTEARTYTIDGQQKEIIVSDLLKQTIVEEDGQMVNKDIGAIEVSVRPDSNFPNKDDAEINVLLKLGSRPNEDGLPIIPSDMILDYVSKKFPSLATGGKYRKELKLLAIGKQALAQQQQAQEQQAEEQKKSPLEAVKRKVQNKITTEAAKTILEGGQNGQTQEGQ